MFLTEVKQRNNNNNNNNQKNNILKRKWLSDLELEEIERNIEDIGNVEVGLENDKDEE